ncbi:MAG TPA: hypothetical protein PKA38_00125 [Candidatus Levybacteria bacterium]|nr:hypothetical protein [Candidatus Levybacteria bacterium]
MTVEETLRVTKIDQGVITTMHKLMRSLCATASLAFVALAMLACGGGISESDLNKTLDARDATKAAANLPDITSNPAVAKIVQDYQTGTIKTSDAAKAQIKALGYTDDQVEAAFRTALNVIVPTPTTPEKGGTPTNPTTTTAPTQTANSLKGTGTKPTFVTNFEQGAWKVSGTDRLKENPIVDGWIHRLQNPAPRLWKTYPNIPNPDVPEFRVVNGTQVPDGVEYGTYSSPYCFAHPCDVPVGAWEYRLITGDYHVMGYECKGDMKKGCLILLINVMAQSVTFRDQDIDNGFTVRGRYWNGDALEWGTWGLVSHASANMLNMPTFAREGEVLNAGDPGNSGANCGTPNGCGTVDARVIVVAGDAVIAVLETTVTR